MRKVGVGRKGTEAACSLVLGSSSLGEVINGLVKGCIVACIVALDLSVVLLAFVPGLRRMYKHVHFDLAPRVCCITIWNRQNSLLRPSMNDVSDMHIARMLRVEGGEVREEAFERRRGGLLETYGVGVDILTINAACLV